MTEMNHADEFFGELQEMGVKFTDETAPAQMPVMESKPIGPGAQKKPTKLVEKAECPFPKPPKGFLENLASCAVWTGVCGGIAMLLWWFEINNLMAQVAAFPCIVVCSILAGLGVGWNARAMRR